MTALIDLVGKNVASADAQAELENYPSLRSDVQGIAGSEEAVHYLRSEREGLLIKCTPDGEIRAIFLMSEGKDGFSEFEGDMPGGLTFCSTPEEAEQVFGEPASRQEARRIGGLELGELLRFDWPQHSIHFQFRGDGTGIDLITAMTARSVPGRRHHETS